MTESMWRQAIPVLLVVAVLLVFVPPLLRWKQRPPPREDERAGPPPARTRERFAALGVMALLVIAILLPLALWIHDAYGLRPGWLTQTGGLLIVLAFLRPAVVLAPVRAGWRRIRGRPSST